MVITQRNTHTDVTPYRNAEMENHTPSPSYILQFPQEFPYCFPIHFPQLFLFSWSFKQYHFGDFINQNEYNVCIPVLEKLFSSSKVYLLT